VMCRNAKPLAPGPTFGQLFEHTWVSSHNKLLVYLLAFTFILRAAKKSSTRTVLSPVDSLLPHQGTVQSTCLVFRIRLAFLKLLKEIEDRRQSLLPWEPVFSCRSVIQEALRPCLLVVFYECTRKVPSQSYGSYGKLTKSMGPISDCETCLTEST